MDEMKKCPFCGEEIKAVAIKCRYCGETLNGKPGNPPETQKSPEPPPDQTVSGGAVVQGKAAGQPQPAGQTIIIQQPANNGKSVAVSTIIVLILAFIVQAITFSLPGFGPLVGLPFYAPLCLVAFILCIVCLCKSQTAVGCLGLLALLIVPWILMLVMPLIMLKRAVTIDDPSRPPGELLKLVVKENPVTQADRALRDGKLLEAAKTVLPLVSDEKNGRANDLSAQDVLDKIRKDSRFSGPAGEEVMKYYEQEAKKGNPFASAELGDIFRERKAYEKGLDYFLLARKNGAPGSRLNNGIEDCCVELADVQKKKKNYDKCMEYLLLSQKNGGTGERVSRIMKECSLVVSISSRDLSKELEKYPQKEQMAMLFSAKYLHRVQECRKFGSDDRSVIGEIRKAEADILRRHLLRTAPDDMTRCFLGRRVSMKGDQGTIEDYLRWLIPVWTVRKAVIEKARELHPKTVDLKSQKAESSQKQGAVLEIKKAGGTPPPAGRSSGDGRILNVKKVSF